MNIDALHTIFANYIRKFDIINNKDHDENYKWRMAARFPSIMNPDSPDFIYGIKEAAKSNLFNGGHYHPLSSLAKCANTDETAVRDLFRALFADDGGDLITRQKKIDAFNDNANALIKTVYANYRDISMFENNQRSAMSYLFFNDPEHHYLYKASEAKAFADAVEFQDFWGPGSDFKMDVFYRMCDELTEEIKKCDSLLETTERRYYDAAGNRIENIHPDKNYHILAFDIIWGTGITDHPDYNFGDGISRVSSNGATVHSDKKMENITFQPRNQ